MRRVLCGLFLGLACFLPTAAHAGMVFSVLFDNDGFRDADWVHPPIVGGGSLGFDETLADGDYLLSSLTNVAFSFTVGGETFTQADTVIFDSDTSIVIYNSGKQFYFNGAGNTTISGGALDVLNGNGSILAFEPNWFSAPPNNLYYMDSANVSVSGTYGVTPEPSSWCLALTGGLVGLGTLIRRRRVPHAG